MKTILITGVSKASGIGYEIFRALQARGHKVFATSRKPESVSLPGLTYGENLLPLDLACDESIENFTNLLSTKISSLDVLINNAAILLDGEAALKDISAEVLAKTFRVNASGPFLLFQKLLPFLSQAPEARVINVSSSAGQLSGSEHGIWAPAYSASKTALNALTQKMAAAYPHMMINSMCPGWCRTDMGGTQAPRSPQEGADTAIWLALDEDPKITGKFFRERQELAW